MTQEQFNEASHNAEAYAMPMVVVRGPNGERSSYDLFSRLLEEDIIFVTGPVTSEMSAVVCGELTHLGAKLAGTEKKISMYIDSPGGSVTAGMAIFDLMLSVRSSGIIIQTIGMGLNASMGSFLLAAGTKGYRAVMPNNQHMIHQPSAGSQGKVTEMNITSEVVNELKDRMRTYYAAMTNMTIAEVEEIWNLDYFTRGEETVKRGIADRVIYPASLINDNVQYAPGEKEQLKKISDVTEGMNKSHLKDREDNADVKTPHRYADLIVK